MPVVKGVTCNKIVATLRELKVGVGTCTDDLDKNVPINDRDPDSGSYIVGFVQNVEADEGNKNLSANTLEGCGHKGITLLERLILELGYFLSTGKHLDNINITLCSGSRGSHGSVPNVSWFPDVRRVCVFWCNPVNSSNSLRSRSAVSLPA